MRRNEEKGMRWSELRKVDDDDFAKIKGEKLENWLRWFKWNKRILRYWPLTKSTVGGEGQERITSELLYVRIRPVQMVLEKGRLVC